MARIDMTILNYFRQRDRGWVLSLLAVVCALYLPFLGNPFVFDDHNFLGEMEEYYAHAGFRFDLRWLSYSSLGWTYAVFSDVQPHFFRLGNILLHAGNVIAVFFLVRRLVGLVFPERAQSPAVAWGAWLGALIFAVHPVAVYAAGYIIQRGILMATLFSLLMLLAYMKGLVSGRKRWMALAVLAYFLACFSKEHSVMMPAVLAALTILLRRENRIARPALAGTWLAFIAIGVLVVLRAKGVMGSPYEEAASTLFQQEGVSASTPAQHALSVMTQAGLFFKYLLLWLLPNPAWMSVDMRETFVSSLGSWQGWLGVAGFVAYGVAAFGLLLRKGARGLAGFALLWPWLLFLVEFSSIRVQEIFVLYRSYLWFPGLALFVPLLLVKWPGTRVRYAVAVLALALIPLAANRLWVFGDDYRLWDDAARLLRTGNESLASRIYYNRGLAEARDKKWEAAAGDYERALAGMQRNEPIIEHDLGVAYYNMGRYPEALKRFDRAITMDPSYASAYFAKGMALKRMHQDDLAMRQMEEACRLKYPTACLIVSADPNRQPKK